MKYCNRPIGSFLIMLLFCLPCCAAPMAVVVDKSNNTAGMTSAELRKIVQGSARKWPDGRNVTFVVHDAASAGMRQVLARLYKLSGQEAKAFVDSHKSWFVMVDSDEALLKLVESTPGAVGLVDVYAITGRVHVMKLDGKLPLEQGYLLH